MMKRVVFDFDGTVVHGDSFGVFVSTQLKNNPLRLVAALALLPLGLPLLFLQPKWGGALFLWLATVGRRPEQYELGVRAFAEEHFAQGAHVYVEALQAIRSHLAAGDAVYVASGCEVRLLRLACRGLGLDESRVVGSTIKRRMGGMIFERHCISETKVVVLREISGEDEYDHVYTDSQRDLPLASRAKRVTLVNAKPSVVGRVKKETSAQVESVNWVTRQSIEIR